MKAPETDNKPQILAPAGTHAARCYRVVDLGTQEESYQGEKKYQRKIKLTFEIGEMHDFGHGLQPFVISNEYTFSMAQLKSGKLSNLRAAVNNWRGKALTDEEARDFDFSKLLGQYAMINIVHKTSAAGNHYTQLASISPMPKGMPTPEPFNDGICFSLDEYTEELFNKLDKFTQDKIKLSPEYKTITKAVL